MSASLPWPHLPSPLPAPTRSSPHEPSLPRTLPPLLSPPLPSPLLPSPYLLSQRLVGQLHTADPNCDRWIFAIQYVGVTAVTNISRFFLPLLIHEAAPQLEPWQVIGVALCLGVCLNLARAMLVLLSALPPSACHAGSPLCTSP